MRPQQSAGPDQFEDVLVGLPRWGPLGARQAAPPTMPGRSRAVQVAGSQARPRGGFRVSAILRAICAAVVDVAPRRSAATATLVPETGEMGREWSMSRRDSRYPDQNTDQQLLTA